MAYVKQEWNNGDIISAEKLNHMEDGIEASLPEACQFNANHTVKLRHWNDLVPMINTWFKNLNPEELERYIRDLWDTEGDDFKYPKGANAITDFFEIKGEDPHKSRYIPFTAVFIIDEVTDSSCTFNIEFNIYGYRILVEDCALETDTETGGTKLIFGEVIDYPEYNVITQIINDEEIPEETQLS